MSLKARLTGALHRCEQALPLQPCVHKFYTLGTCVAKLCSLLGALDFMAEVNGTYSGFGLLEYNIRSV